MKLIVILLLSVSSVYAQQDMQKVRDLFAIINFDESANDELIELTENYSMLANPVLYGYYAGAIMAKASHAMWPPTKLDYFNEGKELLERVIKRFPDNVELRFVRYNVQKGVPDFLDYNAFLAEDKSIILNNIDKLDWSAAYKKEIVEYLNSN